MTGTVAFVPERQSGGSEVVLADAATGRTIAELASDAAEAAKAAFVADGSALVVAHVDGTVSLWRSFLWGDPDRLVARLCEAVGRNLTRAEWTEYLPGESYRKTCDGWPPGP